MATHSSVRTILGYTFLRKKFLRLHIPPLKCSSHRNLQMCNHLSIELYTYHYKALCNRMHTMANISMKQKICLCIVITMLSRKTIAVSESQTTLQELNHNDSLNSVERTFCYPDSVSRMTHEMEDLISTINVDMDRIAL